MGVNPKQGVSHEIKCNGSESCWDIWLVPLQFIHSINIYRMYAKYHAKYSARNWEYEYE